MATESPSIFIVHSEAQAIDALAAAAAAKSLALLLSGKGAGIYAGPTWFIALIEGARSRHAAALAEAILDCDDDAGAVLAAIRTGVETITYSGPAATRRRLNEIATVKGIRILPRGSLWRRALDLDGVAARHRAKVCANWIHRRRRGPLRVSGVEKTRGVGY